MISDAVKNIMHEKNYSEKKIARLEKLGISDETILSWFKLADSLNKIPDARQALSESVAQAQRDFKIEGVASEDMDWVN